MNRPHNIYGCAQAIPQTEFNGTAGETAGFAPIAPVDLQFALDKLSHRFALTRTQPDGETTEDGARFISQCPYPLQSP